MAKAKGEKKKLTRSDGTQVSVTYSFISLDDIHADFDFNVARCAADYEPGNQEMGNLIASMRDGGFMPDEPLLVTELPDSTILLDAGFRRFTAAKIVGVKEVPVLVYDGEENDSYRRERNASENAHVEPTWHGQAAIAMALKDAGLTPEQIAARMCRAREYIDTLLRTRKGLQKLISKHIVPDEEASKLPLGKAKELIMFPIELKEGEKCDTALTAWNHYVKTGSFPSREKENEGAGRKPKDGWSKKEALAALRESPVFTQRGGKVIRWEEVLKTFPPKNTKDLELLEKNLNDWADAVPESTKSPSGIDEVDADVDVDAT